MMGLREMSEQPPQQSGTAVGWDIDRSKKQLDFASSAVAQIIKLAIGAGGLLLIVYAAKERFLFDVSSFSAIGVLLRRGFHYYPWLHRSAADGTLASHI
jgi:hypothetical protein